MVVSHVCIRHHVALHPVFQKIIILANMLRKLYMKRRNLKSPQQGRHCQTSQLKILDKRCKPRKLIHIVLFLYCSMCLKGTTKMNQFTSVPQPKLIIVSQNVLRQYLPPFHPRKHSSSIPDLHDPRNFRTEVQTSMSAIRRVKRGSPPQSKNASLLGEQNDHVGVLKRKNTESLIKIAFKLNNCLL